MSDVQTVRGDAAAAHTVVGAEFVDVVVDATGVVQSVPAHWIGDEVLGRGFTPVDPDDVPAPAAPAAPGPVSDVQLVAGTEGDVSLTPAVRDAAGAAVAEATTKASRKGARKSTGDTVSPDETPDAGNEEN